MRSLLPLLLVAVAACGGGNEAAGRAGVTTSPGSQLDFGVRMAQQGLWNEALFRFEQAERLSPDDPRVLNNLAVAYEATGNFDHALEAYQRALQLDPDNRQLRRNYARFVEFYQSFRPQPEEGVAAEGADGAAATDGPVPAATAPGAPGDGRLAPALVR